MPQMMEPSHTKGLSLDIHPYLMPPGIAGSRDSLHSISRSIDDDKYRPATFITQDNSSIRSFPRTRDDASSIAGSTSRFGAVDDPNSGLLRNAQRMSRSSPPRYRSPTSPAQPPQDYPGPLRSPKPTLSKHDEHGMAGSAATDNRSHERVTPAVDNELHFGLSPTPSLNFEPEGHKYVNENSASHEDRPNFPLSDSGPIHQNAENAQTTTQLPRISLPVSEVTSDYGDDQHKSDFIIPAVSVHGAKEADHHDAPPKNDKVPEIPEEPQNVDPAQDNRRDTRRLTLGVRPLPPEDPADNPEQRANRIRSFYKEYFDDSKRETTYYEDYGSEAYDGGYIYDPTTGDYFDAAPPAPFAEPIGRRAMTPPPRAPPRFQGAARHMATNSAGNNNFGPGPRAFSSASGRLPGPRGPRKPMPPPAPLQILPTPSMLKDDAFMLAADFAPGQGIRERREGRPETPTGGMRPYSPAIRAHTPLASAFDELAVIPSP